MDQNSRIPSLRRQMALIILLCWLLPVVIAASAVGWYVLSGTGRGKEEALSQQFQLNLQLGADRVNSAVEASRLPSYDPDFREAWNQYRRDGEYTLLYRQYSSLFTRLYQSDSRFRHAAFCFSEDPADMSIVVLSSSAGLLSSRQVREQWQSDLPAVLALAAELDTSVGFLEREGRVYLVRNLMDADYRSIGVLALAMDTDYFFGDLALLPWAASVAVDLGRDAALVVKGGAPAWEESRPLEYTVRQQDFTVRGWAAVDYGTLLEGFRTYPWLLGAMALSLLLLLMRTFRFFRRKISRPIQVLMEGAERIHRGSWAAGSTQGGTAGSLCTSPNPSTRCPASCAISSTGSTRRSWPGGTPRSRPCRPTSTPTSSTTPWRPSTGRPG